MENAHLVAQPDEGQHRKGRTQTSAIVSFRQNCARLAIDGRHGPGVRGRAARLRSLDLIHWRRPHKRAADEIRKLVPALETSWLARESIACYLFVRGLASSASLRWPC